MTFENPLGRSHGGDQHTVSYRFNKSGSIIENQVNVCLDDLLQKTKQNKKSQMFE